jgi:hypothetical protein
MFSHIWVTPNSVRRHLLVTIPFVLLATGAFAVETDSGPDDESATGQSNAAESTNEPALSDQPLWEIRLAAFGRYGPVYPASEDSQVDIVPLPFPIYRGKILRIGDETDKPVRTRIFRRDRIKIDMDFGLNFSADSDDIDAREGMPDLDLLLEAGPELELEFESQPLGGRMFLAFQTRGAVSLDGLDPEWRGVVLSTELKYERPFSRDSELILKLTPEWASNDYMDFFYGVAPEFATADRPAYKASSGYLGTKLGVTVKHAVTKKLDIVGGVRFGFYQGARNEDSPLFTQDTNTGVILAFIWKFWESERRAEFIDDRALL